MAYQPSAAPTGDLAAVKTWLQQELASIAQNGPVDAVYYTPLHVEPKKRQDGMVVMADGVDWNPGSGGGLYLWRASAWRFQG